VAHKPKLPPMPAIPDAPIAWPEIPDNASAISGPDPQTRYRPQLASGVVQQLAPLPAMPLYQIDRELMELIALREEMEDSAGAKIARGALPLDVHAKLTYEDECKAVDTRIAQYMTAAREKTDAIAYTIRELLKRSEIAADESARLVKRSASWKAQATRLKDYVLRFMTGATPPITRMETPVNRLRVQGNGGLQPLDVYDASLLPLEYVRWTFSVNGPQLARLREMAMVTEDEELGKILYAGASRPQPDNDAIRAALSQHVVCPACNGVLDVINGCAKCAGRGTVPAEVPGARLLERGKGLRVE
jgi:hypothetical protein